MKYSETYKKSQTKQVPGGFEISMGCKFVSSVTNEKQEYLKFTYYKITETLTVLSDEFNLLTIEYES